MMAVRENQISFSDSKSTKNKIKFMLILIHKLFAICIHIIVYFLHFICEIFAQYNMVYFNVHLYLSQCIFIVIYCKIYA